MAKSDKTRQLSPQQDQAIGLLLLGKTDEAIAAEIGMSRQTVCEWRNHNDLFIATLNERRREVWDGISDRMRSMMLLALDTVFNEIKEGNSEMAMSLLRSNHVDLSRIGSIDVAEIEADRLARSTMIGGRLALAKLDF